MSLQQNVTCTVQENGDASGNYLPGHFIVTVDDGSGAPPAALLSSVQTAVDAVRPLGSTFAIQAPVLISANISLNLVTASSSNSSMAISAVNSAITAYVNTLAVGATLAYTRLAQLAYDASPSVANVNDLTLQGGTADLITGPGSVIKIGTLAIS
jgi:phage-related baseplate assembly protein